MTPVKPMSPLFMVVGFLLLGHPWMWWNLLPRMNPRPDWWARTKSQGGKDDHRPEHLTRGQGLIKESPTCHGRHKRAEQSSWVRVCVVTTKPKRSSPYSRVTNVVSQYN